MVICIIALPILAIMGLFSLRYRTLAKEAFHCMFESVQLKPCTSGLDQRIKSKFTAKLMWSPPIARAFYKYFTILSWIFVILMVVSAGFSGYGLYNYIKYGNCNGPDSSAFCIFNPTGTHTQETCSVFGVKDTINASKVKIEGYPSIGRGDLGILHEYGCYSCPYTKEVEPVVRKILEDYPGLKLVYHDVPMEIHNFSVESGEAAICADEQGMFWRYHDLIFDREGDLENGSFVAFANALDLNISKFNKCLSSNETLSEVEKYKSDAVEVGIYGTPTFIFGEKSLVGPQSYKNLKNLVM